MTEIRRLEMPGDNSGIRLLLHSTKLVVGIVGLKSWTMLSIELRLTQSVRHMPFCTKMCDSNRPKENIKTGSKITQQNSWQLYPLKSLASQCLLISHCYSQLPLLMPDMFLVNFRWEAPVCNREGHFGKSYKNNRHRKFATRLLQSERSRYSWGQEEYLVPDCSCI